MPWHGHHGLPVIFYHKCNQAGPTLIEMPFSIINQFIKKYNCAKNHCQWLMLKPSRIMNNNFVSICSLLSSITESQGNKENLINNSITDVDFVMVLLHKAF